MNTLEDSIPATTASVLLLTLFVLACSATLNVAAVEAVAAADAPSSKVDPCTLVTAAEAQAVLGVAIVAPASSDDSLFRHCIFTSADKRKYLYLDARDLKRDIFEKGMKTVRSGLPVAGDIGADAYTDKSSGTLLVWKNGTTLNILIGDQSGNTSDEKKEAAEEKIARIALSHL
jgi:hypothetical protein